MLVDPIHALQILRVKGFAGPIDIETGLRDNALLKDGFPSYDENHVQRHFSTVRIYDSGIVEKGANLEDVIHKQILKQTD